MDDIWLGFKLSPSLKINRAHMHARVIENKRNTIYSITQRYIRLNKNKGLVEPLVLI